MLDLFAANTGFLDFENVTDVLFSRRTRLPVPTALRCAVRACCLVLRHPTKTEVGRIHFGGRCVCASVSGVFGGYGACKFQTSQQVLPKKGLDGGTFPSFVS